MDQDQNKNQLETSIEQLNAKLHNLRKTISDMEIAERSYNAFFENINEGAVALDSHGAIVFCNSIFAQMLGLSQRELQGRPFIEFILGESHKRFLDTLSGLASAPVRASFALVDQSRTTFTVHLSLRKVAAGDNVSVCMIVTDCRFKSSRDTAADAQKLQIETSKFKIKRNIEQLEREKYQQLFALAPDGYLQTNLQGVIEEANYTAGELFKSSEDQLRNKALIDFVTERDLASYVEILKTIRRKTRILRHINLNMRTSEGQVFPASISVGSVNPGQGEDEKLRWIIRDISELKKIESALIASQQRFQNLAESLPQIIWTSLPDGTIEYINERCKEYTGFSLPSSIKNWHRTLHPDDVQHTLNQWKQAVETGRTYQVEHRIKRHDGQYHWFLSICYPQKDEQGNIVRWFGTTTDIHQQKAAQMEQLRLKDELQRKNEELESIISVASHDLRSPLVNIKGFANEIAKSTKDLLDITENCDLADKTCRQVNEILKEEFPQAIGFIQSSADMINSLLQGLLQVARAGMVTANIVDLNMDDIMAVIASNLEYKLKESAATLIIEHLPSCRGDETQISQIFTNLIDNAIKYRSPERPCRIRIYGCETNGDSLFCVVDNGLGIRPEHIEDIFKVFYRIGPEDKTGQGLGLAIVRRMVERHNGRIWADSTFGKGSLFYVVLPR